MKDSQIYMEKYNTIVASCKGCDFEMTAYDKINSYKGFCVCCYNSDKELLKELESMI
jgi:hypothetical protein